MIAIAKYALSFWPILILLIVRSAYGGGDNAALVNRLNSETRAAQEEHMTKRGADLRKWCGNNLECFTGGSDEQAGVGPQGINSSDSGSAGRPDSMPTQVGGWTRERISNTRTKIYSNGSLIADIQYSYGWTVYCEKGRKYGARGSTQDLDTAIQEAMSQCKT